MGRLRRFRTWEMNSPVSALTRACLVSHATARTLGLFYSNEGANSARPQLAPLTLRTTGPPPLKAERYQTRTLRRNFQADSRQTTQAGLEFLSQEQLLGARPRPPAWWSGLAGLHQSKPGLRRRQRAGSAVVIAVVLFVIPGRQVVMPDYPRCFKRRQIRRRQRRLRRRPAIASAWPPTTALTTKRGGALADSCSTDTG